MPDTIIGSMYVEDNDLSKYGIINRAMVPVDKYAVTSKIYDDEVGTIVATSRIINNVTHRTLIKIRKMKQ